MMRTIALIGLSWTLVACAMPPDSSPQVAAQSSAEPREASPVAASIPSAPAAPPVAKPAWIKRTETHGGTGQDGKISMAATSIQPLYEGPGKTDTIFTQVNVVSSAQTESPTGTSNIGLGYRKLIERDLMVGVNGFYDRDWAQAIERTSADAELRWRAFNMAVNYYAAQNDRAETRALGGYDVAVGSQLPYLPWAQTTLTRSELSDRDQAARETYSAAMKLDLVRYVQLEAGVRGDGANPEAGIVKLNFSLLPGQWGSQRRTAFGHAPISDTILEARDLAPATLDKVKRDNTIQTAN